MNLLLRLAPINDLLDYLHRALGDTGFVLLLLIVLALVLLVVGILWVMVYLA